MSVAAALSYQRRHIERGLCMLCNEPRVNANLCQKHNEARKQRRRKLAEAPDPPWLEAGITKREWKEMHC